LPGAGSSPAGRLGLVKKTDGAQRISPVLLTEVPQVAG
jgi:hypothetical protein